MKNPADIAKKWAKNLGSSTDSIRQGVMAVTTAPTERAASRSDAYAEGVARSVASGKWQAALRKVTLPDWQRAMNEKGLSRIAPGAQAAVPKMETFMSEFLPYVEQGQNALRNTPRGDINQNIQRMVQMVQHMAAFKRR